jgi:hypothetical protein
MKNGFSAEVGYLSAWLLESVAKKTTKKVDEYFPVSSEKIVVYSGLQSKNRNK